MATNVLQNCKLWVDGIDMSGWMNRLGLEYASEPQEATAWGNTTRVMKGGLKGFAFSHQGLWQTPGPTETIAFDSCTAANGTAFGVSKPNLPPTRNPERGFGGWIVDTPTAYKIQSNKAEQQIGHGGGVGGKYCTSDVASDDFTYFADIVQDDPAITGMGLGFRYEENPEDGSFGNFWEQHADGLSVEMSSSAANVVSLRFLKRLAGSQQGTVIATGVSTPFRMILVVSGSNLDVFSEPISGGARTLIVSGVDLAQNLGTTDDFNDTGHQRFGLVSGSNPDIGSTFDNITVQMQNADKVLFDSVGAGASFALAPLTGAVGEVAYLAQSSVAKYEPGPLVIGDLFRFGISGNGAGPLIRGVVLENGTVAATDTGTAIQQGGVGATQKMYALLHVLSVSDASIAVRIESDDNESFTSAETRFTFNTVAVGESVEWATPVDGAIGDTWWRVAYTIAGGAPSISFVLAMGIQ